MCPNGQKWDHGQKWEQLRPFVAIVTGHTKLPQFIVAGGHIRVALFGCSYGGELKEVCRVSRQISRQVSEKDRTENCHAVAHNGLNSNITVPGASRIAFPPL
jgi:hypothetical protein